MPTEESKAVSKHERKPESLTLKEKYLYFRVATFKHEILFYTLCIVIFILSFFICDYFYEKLPKIPSPKNVTTFNENFAKVHVHYLSKIIGTS